MSDTTGRTQDAGYQIGVSKTLPYPVEQVWELITSAAGLALWLGEDVDLTPTRGAPYRTADGSTGEVRGWRETDRIRVTSRVPDWDHDTTVQVAMSASGPGRTVLRFHQEWLSDAGERARQRTHWQGVMAAVERALAAPNE
ncbi:MULTISPECIES: SRPBCC domain-containing protein [unclassified Embleya]|uniref:SRPBCC family protein n=1 Tax=unclassified Embleya TaxID=2699296 RepID=UPI0033D5601F